MGEEVFEPGKNCVHPEECRQLGCCFEAMVLNGEVHYASLGKKAAVEYQMRTVTCEHQELHSALVWAMTFLIHSR